MKSKQVHSELKEQASIVGRPNNLAQQPGDVRDDNNPSTVVNCVDREVAAYLQYEAGIDSIAGCRTTFC